MYNNLKSAVFGVRRLTESTVLNREQVIRGDRQGLYFSESSTRQDTAPTLRTAGFNFRRGAAQADLFCKPFRRRFHAVLFLLENISL